MVRTIDLEFQNKACAIASYIIESGDEGPVMIETGPYSTFQALKEGVEAAEPEYKIENIKHVFLTHIHLDHAGAAWALAENGAKIYVHPLGAPHLVDPSKLMESARRIYEDKMDTLWGDMKAIPADQVHEVQDGEEITLGNLTFKAHYTPGHAKHHIAWQLDKIIFTGDVAGVQIGQGPVVAPLPPPDIDVEAWKESMDLLRNLNATAFYLTHYGAVTDTEKQLTDLQNNIETQANWVKEHLDAGESVEDMIPKFEEFTTNQLTEAGLSDVELEQYQAANPAYMSVAGLARYWQKKEA